MMIPPFTRLLPSCILLLSSLNLVDSFLCHCGVYLSMMSSVRVSAVRVSGPLALAWDWAWRDCCREGDNRLRGTCDRNKGPSTYSTGTQRGGGGWKGEGKERGGGRGVCGEREGVCALTCMVPGNCTRFCA